MKGQAFLVQENNIGSRIKRNYLFTIEVHFFLLGYLFHPRGYFIHIEGNRVFPTQAQHYGYICAMPYAGLGKGTI